MKKVLILNTTGMGYEGISYVILNYINKMKLDGISLHVVTCPTTKPEMEEKIRRVAEVHMLPKKKQGIKDYLKALAKLLNDKYDVIHIHGNSGMMFFEVMLAKLKGVKKIIVHSHNTTCDHIALHKLLKRPMKWLATDLVACSRAAGEWLYGKSRFTVLNNAIDLQRFAFDDNERGAYRAEFGVGDSFVFGHIGHFTEQKNHEFLIDIFEQIHKLNDKAKLILVSVGPRFDRIMEKVRLLGLDSSVIFAGQRSDVDKLYQAFDVFLLPSLWEGLPLVMLEAQAAALPVVVSDAVTADAKCTDRVKYLSLESAEEWARAALESAEKYKDRTIDVFSSISDAGFNIEKEAQTLRNIYLGE